MPKSGCIQTLQIGAHADRDVGGDSRSESVYSGLRRAIIEQALMPGDKLDRRCDRRAVRRQPDDRQGRLGAPSMPKVLSTCRPTRRGRRPAKPVGGPGRLRSENMPGAAGSGRLVEKGHGQGHQRLEQHVALESKAKAHGGPAAIRLGRRVPYSSSRALRQSAFSPATSTNWRLALLADPGDVQPAALLRVLGQLSTSRSSMLSAPRCANLAIDPWTITCRP